MTSRRTYGEIPAIKVEFSGIYFHVPPDGGRGIAEWCLLSEGRVSSIGRYVSSTRGEVSSERRSIRAFIKPLIKTLIRS